MFLVTTADERSWKMDEKILFLGEWCKLYSRKEVWDGLDHEVLPYHWDDRAQLYSDYQYLTEVYERYLIALSCKLNGLHKCDHSLRYWRILIGPWLRYFIDNVFDRYRNIKRAAESGMVSSSWIMHSDDLEWIPNDFGVFYQNLFSDGWNHFIFGKIVKMLKLVPFCTIDAKNSPFIQKTKSKSESILKKILKYCSEQYTRCVPDCLSQITFINSYFGLLDLARLQLSLRQIPCPYAVAADVPDHPIQKNKRGDLKVFCAQNEYESVLDELIHMQMPVVYVESYFQLRAKALQKFPKRTKVICTATAYSHNDLFKVWASECVKRGAKLLIAQHGGYFGIALWEPTLDHQLAIADRFYSWGWKLDGNKKIRSLPAPKLVHVKKRVKSNSHGNILLVLMELPRYSYLMTSWTMASQYLYYVSDQIEFVKNLDSDAFELLKICLPDTYRSDIRDRLEDVGIGGKVDYSNQSFFRRLNQSRVCVATYNGTTFLETFAANFPTLLFWNPKYWEVLPSVKPYLDELRYIGILHDSPQSAAQKLNAIYEDPFMWWMQPDVQLAKDRFFQKFAHTDENWLSKWKTELASVKEEYKT